MARHLLVTNDFPPKIGGIQSYLYELWRRLDPDDVCVLTTPFAGAEEFDRAQDFRVERVHERVLLPTSKLGKQIDHLAKEHGAELVILDPLAPLGALGPKLAMPYGIVVHGAEVTVPARVGLVKKKMASVLAGASLIIAAGEYPGAEAQRVAGQSLPLWNIPPGVDTKRFAPLTRAVSNAARDRWGFQAHDPLIVSVSRLVPRKGMDVLVRASARLVAEFPGLQVAIGGTGRDTKRLQHLIERYEAPVRLVGRIDDADLPAFVGMADVFAMLCRNRWVGVEQEGFGIVFLEAAACGVAQVAGRSGGSADAVVHEQTGLIVDDPASVASATGALRRLLLEPMLRNVLGDNARERSVTSFDYDLLAKRLGHAIDDAVS